jgi:hypothetical protein
MISKERVVKNTTSWDVLLKKNALPVTDASQVNGLPFVVATTQGSGGKGFLPIAQ